MDGANVAHGTQRDVSHCCTCVKFIVLCRCKAMQSYALVEFVPFWYVVVEVMFAELLRQPQSTLVHLAYSSFMVELEKHPKYGRSVSTVLSIAAERLFTNIEAMQPACIDR